MSIAQLVRDGQPVFDVGTSELDFMCVSQQYGRLRIGGTLLQSKQHLQKLKKLRIAASAGVAVASFSGIEVPIEVVTEEHGTFLIQPNPGTTILPLIAPPGVLGALDLAAGFSPGQGMNIEAILGVINELRFEDGKLNSAAGKRVSVAACVALLCRLGVKGTDASDSPLCMKAFSQLGIKPERPRSLLAALRVYASGRAGKLRRYIAVLEERGTRIRLKQRFKLSCHPHYAEMEHSEESYLQLTPAMYKLNLARAA